MRLSNQKFALLFTFLYGLLLIWLLPFHELWPDETEPWLLALYSDSYTDLLHNKRFEGHPNLWYSLLYVITRFTDNLQALKISHFFFSVGFVFVFLRYAPFHWLIRLLFCFGYYGVYEYGLISRLYAPEIFTMFLVCAFYQKRFSHWYAYIFLLALNAQTHLFGLYFSGAMGLLLFAEALWPTETVPAFQKVNAKRIGLGVLLWLVGCGVSFWSITHFLGFAHGHIWDPYKIQQASTRVWQAFFPVPEFLIQFWNTSYLRTKVEIPLSLLLVLLLLLTIRPKQLLLCILLLFAGLYYFFAFKFGLSLRHHAHFFLFTVAILWIATHYRTYTPSLKPKELFPANVRVGILNYLLLFTTITQFLCGIYALYIEYNYSFYPAKEATAYLEKHFPDYLLATTEEFPSSTITAYSGKPIFNLSRGEYVTFYDLDMTIENKLTPYQNLQWAKVWAQKNNKPVLLISSREIAIEHFPYPVKHIRSFDRKQIVSLPQDRFIYFYLVEPGYFPTYDFVVGPVADTVAPEVEQ